MPDFREMARTAASKYGVDPNIFERQIAQESQWNPNAKSPAGALGLAQLMPVHWGNVDPTDPAASLDYAARLMAGYLGQYNGDYKTALAAYNCFDDQTEVLTRYLHKDGSHGPIKWKLFADLKAHDEVGTYNLRSGRVMFRRPAARQVYDYNGLLCHFMARGVDCRVTPNHRMIATSNPRWKPKLKEAGTLRPGTRILSSAGGHDFEYPLCDDELRIAAWILTDGTINQSSRSTRVLIYQRASKARLVKEILDRLGWDYSVRVITQRALVVAGRTLLKPAEPILHMRLRASSRDVLLRFLPQKASLPEWVYALSVRQFRVFLEAFVDGDGSRHPKAKHHYQITGQPAVMEHLQTAAIMNGCRASIRRPKQGNYLRLNVVVDQRWTKPHVTQEVYAGKVYCVTTQNGTVVTRRRGCVVITGNSGPGNVAKYGGVPPFAETQTYVQNILGPHGGQQEGVQAVPLPDVAEQFRKPYWLIPVVLKDGTTKAQVAYSAPNAGNAGFDIPGIAGRLGGVGEHIGASQPTPPDGYEVSYANGEQWDVPADGSAPGPINDAAKQADKFRTAQSLGSVDAVAANTSAPYVVTRDAAGNLKKEGNPNYIPPAAQKPDPWQNPQDGSVIDLTTGKQLSPPIQGWVAGRGVEAPATSRYPTTITHGNKAFTVDPYTGAITPSYDFGQEPPPEPTPYEIMQETGRNQRQTEMTAAQAEQARLSREAENMRNQLTNRVALTGQLNSATLGAVPYMVDPSWTTFPGFEQGGPMAQLYRMSGGTNYQPPVLPKMQFDPEAAWRAAQGLIQ